MQLLIASLAEIAAGFRLTLLLFLASACLALVAGTALAIASLLPVGILRRLAAGYVAVMCNTPVVLVFFLITFGFPQLGLRLSFFVYATLALALYEASYICESLRSGFNTIAPGQSQAARSLGMDAITMLRTVLLPQAVANAIPAIGNNLISLAKATALAGSFGVVEATAQLHRLTIDNPGEVFTLFAGIASGYVVLNLAIAALMHCVESRMAFTR
ncbi:MAG: amino acid ABC transporter permease [Candidatus Dactylopiibacterium carminicum]|uniref:Amino acid ABC transporter permease n=1 Tax=Candidatus Dactylopiibacterium carminicum TaxID=857335 RepID=A0A272EVY2_9RHOO|nr:amino acid ABC transporter permease [Candidatus Dactylopiibacterium carminicum]KAF7599622.1 amino acid ABC transporter permease [Candidatus Dactylopiibacterium carminicum]PAS94269.1 MAG: amino acid ABC transporter permease [Candidatus Dactylopiibacterium carminicum]PAS98465.1 MAG: amino acid ABC transporter permease [Candidatus Dactylopiibacterium carminicum]PAS99625.1 MAG: hypothetical protein BSR46_07135 [Candidatus Dactylopiibacterium carminicum]